MNPGDQGWGQNVYRKSAVTIYRVRGPPSAWHILGTCQRSRGGRGRRRNGSLDAISAPYKRQREKGSSCCNKISKGSGAVSLFSKVRRTLPRCLLNVVSETSPRFRLLDTISSFFAVPARERQVLPFLGHREGPGRGEVLVSTASPLHPHPGVSG